jgi:ribokinase
MPTASIILVKRARAPICEHAQMRAAVVGHIEWLEFVPIEHVPRPGEIVHASESWEQAAGGGSVAAVQLAQLADSVDFFTVLGSDEHGELARVELEARGITVHATVADAPQRSGFTFLDDTGERTITTIGRKLHPRGHDETLPWHELGRCEAVYFCAGDADALIAARRARVLVATARELSTLRQGSVELDALVSSGKDEAERYHPGQIDPEPRLVVTTSGRLGGWAQPGGPYTAAPLPPDPADAYGAGDCFAAGLAFALAAGLEGLAALDFAARCGAGALAGQGVHAEAVPLP